MIHDRVRTRAGLVADSARSEGLSTTPRMAMPDRVRRRNIESPTAAARPSNDTVSCS
jgi:hypothetical protein